MRTEAVSSASPRIRNAHLRAWAAIVVASVSLTWASLWGQLSIGLTEVFGFATGAACVLLVVEESIWNFPVGLANNAFFLVLFFSARLYADMGLQIVYFALGVAGWWRWTHGMAEGHGHFPVSRASGREWIVLGTSGLLATVVGSVHLRRIGDAAPVLDALTTVLSLIAQWLLNQKKIDNWWVWIAADVLYVGLYVRRGLGLTACLYFVFILMCLAGLRSWNASLRCPRP
jgi:nicotinamide mononucleotide transporter